MFLLLIPFSISQMIDHIRDYSTIIFLDILFPRRKNEDLNVMETMQNPTLPGYSSHGGPIRSLTPASRCNTRHWSAPLRTAAEDGWTEGMSSRSERDFDVEKHIK